MPAVCDTDTHYYIFCGNLLKDRWLHQNSHLYLVAMLIGKQDMSRHTMDYREQ